MLDLRAVTVSRQRLALFPLLAAVYAASCAVFPDEAVLPAASDNDLGGGGNGAVAGSSSEAGSPIATSGVGGGLVDYGGGSGLAGAADAGNGGAGGVIEPSEGGAGGTGIVPCADPQQTVVIVSEDTWIGSAKDVVTHGDDVQLFVDTGADERRMLLWVNLPAVPDGAWLLKATLILNLESNADVAQAERRLGLHLLSKSFVEGKATWVNFSNGNNRWAMPGGDYGAILARATLPAGSSSGPLSFDVTTPVAMAYAAAVVPLPLIIREVGLLPAAPAALAFTSAEGDASQPSLLVEYCLP